MKLTRCIFCDKVLNHKELTNKTPEGTWCKPCYTWWTQEFIPLIRKWFECP